MTGCGVVPSSDVDDWPREREDPRDYDVDHYERVLLDIFASRFLRAFTPDDYAAVFADPDQPSLFTRPLGSIVPVLTRL